MTNASFIKRMSTGINDVAFIYNGNQSGIECEVDNSRVTYSAWYGNFYKDYTDLNTLLKDAIFGGKTILEILPKLELEFY